MLPGAHVSGIELVLHGLEKGLDSGYVPVYSDEIVKQYLSVDVA